MALYLDRDPLSGAIETFEYDENDDLCIIKRQADVQPVIDRNKELQNHTDGWVGQGRDMRLAASTPIDVALLWLQKYGVSCWKAEHWPYVRRLLNSNEWRHLRTNTFYL